MANENENKPAEAPKATPEQPKAANQQQSAPKAAQQTPQSPRKADGTTPPTIDEGEKAIAGNPMTRDNMDAPAAKVEGEGTNTANASPAEAASNRRAPKPARFGPMPGPAELAKIRKAKFGDGPGAVRLDAAPANSGPDSEGTQLVFVDGNGRVVGREAYVPGNYR